MARGDTQRELAEAATRDGLVLARQSMTWLNRRGHLGIPEDAEDEVRAAAQRSAKRALQRIYLAVGGDLDALEQGRMTRLPGDFLHESTGTLIEVDESQHFTSFRLRSLELFPADVNWDSTSAPTSSTAKRGGSALMAISGPRRPVVSARTAASGNAPTTTRCGTSPRPRWGSLLRVEAADRNPADAYQRHRPRLLQLLA